jgi:hypothetical protein
VHTQLRREALYIKHVLNRNFINAAGLTIVTDEELAFRIEVLETFAGTLTPLARVDEFAPIISRGIFRYVYMQVYFSTGNVSAVMSPVGDWHSLPFAFVIAFVVIYGYHTCRCPTARQMEDLLATAMRLEKESVRLTVEGEPFALIFDGTTRLGELMVVVYRVIDEQLQPVQRLAAVQTLKQSVNAIRLCALLTDVLQDMMNITANNCEIHRLVCVNHDSASVNGAAMRQLVCHYICMVHAAVRHTIIGGLPSIAAAVIGLVVVIWPLLFALRRNISNN